MIYIGIDPGTKTGIAVYNDDIKKILTITTMGIIQALFYVDYLKDEYEDLTIILEDARLRKWIPKEKNESEYRGKLMGSGSIKRDCAIWEEYCKHEGINLIKQPPKKGLTKLNDEMFEKITHWKEKTDSHAKDATMIIINKIL